MALKSTNLTNYKIIKSVADIFCDEKYPDTSIKEDVFFEHGQFWLTVNTEYQTDTYSVVDAGCEICNGEMDYCFNCKRCNGIDFELIESTEI